MKSVFFYINSIVSRQQQPRRSVRSKKRGKSFSVDRRETLNWRALVTKSDLPLHDPKTSSDISEANFQPLPFNDVLNFNQHGYHHQNELSYFVKLLSL
jgi:hypothetical protein